MNQYYLQEIAKILNGEFIGTENPIIKNLVTDSRNLISSENSLFFAIQGERHNGHKFIEDLFLRKNLKNFIIDDNTTNIISECNYIKVSNTIEALQKLAIHQRNLFKGTVIGITGSNGKTIVKEWLFQLLRQDKTIVRSPKSYNSQIGVPLSVWNLENAADTAIFEAGISKPGEMEKLEPIIKPNIGIFTNIGEAHQENFLSIQRKVREKLRLFSHSDTLIYCSDHDYIAEEIDDWVNSEQTILNWSHHKKATLQITETQISAEIATIKANYLGNLVNITIPFTDSASIENAIHCWLLLLHFGYSSEIISERMKSLTAVEMRLELKKGINNCTIINDSYNSDIFSLGIALDFLNQQQQHANKTLILSDILQSGKTDQQLYTEISNLLINKKINRLIGIGPALFRNASLFSCQKSFFNNTEEFLNQLHDNLFRDEAILLKGARNFEFERILLAIENKAHRTVLEINLSAMAHNLNYFRSKLKPTTKIVAMVKAFSYGSGTYEIANMLEYQKVDYLAVAIADEGVALRQAGISLPIMVMNLEESAFNLMVDYRLEPEVYSFSQLNKLINHLNKNQIENFPIHIKVETGMNRLGFMPEEINDLCLLLKHQKNIKIQSIFSHLAASDEPNYDDFTRVQIARFENISNQIIESSGYPISRHILNSMGIERFPEFQFEMVRLGIGLYGVNPFNQYLLRNVSSLKTTISQIKTVLPDETIGYNRNGKINRKTRIAVIPIGYADGYNRKMGNGMGNVVINKQIAPIIGNICMDLSMVDVTNIKAEEGDSVEIFGDNISISDIATKIGTIPYEVLTGISGRVKRNYIQE